MADQPRTQKQIAQKYKDNLDYYRRGHFLRRLKLALFLLAVFGSIGAVFGFRFWGNKQFFNTGPISQNHARFANDCAACHDGAETDLTRALKLDQAVTDLKEGNLPSVDLEKLKAASKNFSAAELAAAAQRNLSPDRLSALQQAVIKKSSLAGMDRACLKCHNSFQLHQPQMEALKLRGVHPEMPLVHSDRCSTCHREHVGHGLMAVPGSESCATCHADLQELARTRNVIKVGSPSPPVRPENRDLGDGLIRFLMPQEANAQPAVIRSYADGHPPFRYEEPTARDPAVIKYNHLRHEQKDIPAVRDGRKLACADCHQLGKGGAFYEPVKYQQHCATCHALNVVPELPGFTIPHADPAAVVVFTNTLNSKILAFLIDQDPSAKLEDLVAKVKTTVGNMVSRGDRPLSGFGERAGNELQRRIFYTGDPTVDGRISGSGMDQPKFTACVGCHEVTKGDGTVPYKITKTNIADRWIHHGPFTHQPHTHMLCIDCHHKEIGSRNTADILLPSQASCAQCHSPLRKDKVLEVVAGGIAPKPRTPEMVEKQKREGGVKWECQNCHQFHAPPEAIQMLESASAK